MTTNYGAASLVAKLGSSKTTEHTQTHRKTDTQHGTLKPNSINAVRLKNEKSIIKYNKIQKALTRPPFCL